ncbi:MAG TPA: 4'-phosphopantetheinyl transferase superfamily protein [Planctomycetota bacterium]|nr:4'-phosphopantetheinyl transferase superfamily protein [Planctomycetota bacterium]
MSAGEAIYFLSAAGIEGPDLEAWLSAAPAHLDAGERARLERYIFPEKKLEFALGRLLLKSVLAARHGVEDPRIGDDARGKPCLVDRPGGPFFNLSHSRGALAAIVSPSREVAIDIEAVRPYSAGLAGKVLSPAERARVRETADFYRFWTAKEAFMKLEGRGLAIPPLRLEVDLDARTVRDLATGALEPFAGELRGAHAVAWMARATPLSGHGA